MASLEVSLRSKILTWCFARERLARIFPIFSCSDPRGVRTVTWTAAYAASPNRLLRLSIVS